MKIRLVILSSLLFLLPIAQADILSLSPDAQISKAQHIPTRGQTMKTVRKQCGKPKHIHKSKGPIKPQWPRITRWDYDGYSVYFERHIVLHTVVH